MIILTKQRRMRISVGPKGKLKQQTWEETQDRTQERGRSVQPLRAVALLDTH